MFLFYLSLKDFKISTNGDIFICTSNHIRNTPVNQNYWLKSWLPNNNDLIKVPPVLTPPNKIYDCKILAQSYKKNYAFFQYQTTCGHKCSCSIYLLNTYGVKIPTNMVPIRFKLVIKI